MCIFIINVDGKPSVLFYSYAIFCPGYVINRLRDVIDIFIVPKTYRVGIPLLYYFMCIFEFMQVAFRLNILRKFEGQE